MLGGELLMRVNLDRLHVVKIHLVANETHERWFATCKRLSHQAEPVLQVQKRLKICDIIRKNNSVCFVNIGANHLAEEALAADVPNLKRYVLLLRQLQALDKKVNSNRLFVASTELVLAKSRNH